MADEQPIRELLTARRFHEAFEGIVETFRDKVFHLSLSFMHNESMASDCAQDTLLRVWKALPTYRGEASLSTWIYTITRNVCFTQLARAKRGVMLSLDDPDFGELAESMCMPEPVAAGSGMDAEVLLACLPDKYQRVLRLFYLEQKSYDETAAMLGIPVGTVKSYLFRARKELAGWVARGALAAESVTD